MMTFSAHGNVPIVRGYADLIKQPRSSHLNISVQPDDEIQRRLKYRRKNGDSINVNSLFRLAEVTIFQDGSLNPNAYDF